MKFSIITPTHDCRWLLAAYASLCAQTDPEWEWVIVPNGGAWLPDEVISDPRVTVHTVALPMGVGALKRYASEHARGEWLVELDHDDWLAPQALERIGAAAADFVYSDFANVREDGSSYVYGVEHGWETYPAAPYTAMRAFLPSANTLSAIHYAPNHVRAWRRDAYWQVGGHDPALTVCDDYDLVLRTYLAGVSFEHIPECLYFYRERTDGSNTYVARNQEIQTLQAQLSDRYLYALVAEECRRDGTPMLDLGGAHDCPPGYIAIDLPTDIRQGLPYADASVGAIRAHDFLEHIPHCRDSLCTHDGERHCAAGAACVVGVMNEIFRVLKPGGWLLSMTPSSDGRGAFQDPTHCSFWNPNSFWYYTRSTQQKYVPGIKTRFREHRLFQGFPSDWHREHNIPYVYAYLVACKGMMAGQMFI